MSDASDIDEKNKKREAFHREFSARLFGGRTVQDIADAAGVTRNTADGWKNKGVFPQVYEMKLIAEAFKIPPGQLTFGVTDDELLALDVVEFLRSKIKEGIHTEFILDPKPRAAQSLVSRPAVLSDEAELKVPAPPQSAPTWTRKDSPDTTPPKTVWQRKRK